MSAYEEASVAAHLARVGVSEGAHDAHPDAISQEILPMESAKARLLDGFESAVSNVRQMIQEIIDIVRRFKG